MYTSQLTGQEIDSALLIARGIGQRQGVPVSSGNGTIQARRLDSILTEASTGIPESPAVWAAIKDRTSNYLHFKGTVATADDLPAEPETGDAYHVSDTGANVAWDGEQWADVGSIATFDITPEDIGAAKQADLEALRTDLDELDSEVVKVGSLFDLVYPVGSIYMSLTDTSPASLFGGSWAQIKDVFLLGAGDTYEVTAYEKDGGDETVTLTAEQIPSHAHGVKYVSKNVGSGSGTSVRNPDSGGASYTSTNESGGGNAHNNMPPYKTVYMWQRIE